MLKYNQYTSYNHNHNFNEILYVAKGSAEVTYKSDTIKTSEQTMILVPSGITHSFNGFYGAVVVTISFWGDLRTIFENQNMDKDIALFSHPNISNLFDRMIEYYNGNFNYKNELMGLLFEELIYITKGILSHKKATEENSNNTQYDNYRSYLLEKYLQTNFNKSPRLSELSKLLNLSNVHTQRIIKKMYNKPFSKIILDLRMEYARSLLLEKELSVC